MSYPCLVKLVSFVSTIVFLLHQELLVNFRVLLNWFILIYVVL